MGAWNLRENAGRVRQVFQRARGLLRASLPSALLVGALLSLLPALLRGFLLLRSLGGLPDLWAAWVDAVLSGQTPPVSLLSLLSATRQVSSMPGLWPTLFGLFQSLLLKPVLLSSLALLFTVPSMEKNGARPALRALENTWRRAGNLVAIALVCMLAEYFIQLLPYLITGLLSAIAGLLSFIPVVGSVAQVLSAVLSELLPPATEFLMNVVFCYVWVAAMCENISGFGALMRSWQLTRNALRETLSALAGITLLRWTAVLLLALLWVSLGRALSLPPVALVYSAYAAGALFTVYLGATTAALYQRRPVHRGPLPGQFSGGGPNLREIKQASPD